MKKNIKSNLTIETAKETAEILSKYLKTSENPVIDLSVLEKIDLAGIQILLSTQKSGENQKKDVFFTGIIKKSVYDRIFRTGFNIVQSDSSGELFKIRRNSSEI